MSYKEEFVVSPQMSMRTFPRNTPMEFKYVLDIEHTHRFHNVGFRVRKVLCTFEKVHYNGGVKPSIILSSDVETESNSERGIDSTPDIDYLMLQEKNSISTAKVNLGDIRASFKKSPSGEGYMRHVRYLIITSRYLNKNKFVMNVQESLNALGVKTIIFTQDISGRYYFKGSNLELPGVFFSNSFLYVCGFTNEQLSKIPSLLVGPESDLFFKVEDVINLTPHKDCCSFISPPEFINVFSPSVCDNIHDFDIDEPTKICEVDNEGRKYNTVNSFRGAEWVRANRIRGGVLDILVQNSKPQISNVSARIRSIVIHIEINKKQDLSMPKSIFCELKSDLDGDGLNHQIFLTKLSSPINIKSDNRICIKSIRIPTFNTVFGHHKMFYIYRKTPHGAENKNLELRDSYFESEESLVKCLNDLFIEESLYFSLEKSRITISNKSSTDSVVIRCSSEMMTMLGRSENNEGDSLEVRNNSEYIFKFECDIFKMTPSVLSINPTFLCTNSIKDMVPDERHITFFDKKTSQVITFDDYYEHQPGFYNYLQVLIRNPLKNEFSFTNNVIYCCIHIDQ